MKTTKFNGQNVDLTQGLTPEQVRDSEKTYGKNILSPPERDPWWKQLLEKFDDPTIRILLAAAVVSLLMTILEKFVLGHPDASFVDSIGIIAAVLLATLAGFFSELKSAHEFELLNKVKEDILIKVIRAGQICEISITELVVGDVVHLDLGDKVPADGVLLQSLGLLIDQSLLTGESVPVEKTAFEPQEDNQDLQPLLKDDKIDEDHLVYRGTMVNDGHGAFLITQVGDNTKLGHIAATLGKEGENESETPLTHKLSILAKQISTVGICSALLIFTVMSIFTLWGAADLMKAHGFAEMAVITILSVVIGALVVRFAVRPFFSSMDIELEKPLYQILAAVPFAIAVFGITVGLWGIIDGANESTTSAVVSTETPPVPDAPLTENSDPEAPLAENSDPETPLAEKAGPEAPVVENTVSDTTTKKAFDLLRGLLTVFVIAVTIIVVAVPEGLPMMVTVSLAMNMMKMTRENCLIRKLIASETIGSATVVCSDKTGTLTQNRMSTTWALFDMKQYNGEAEIASLKDSPDWTLLLESICSNTEAALRIEKVNGIGNPTECALLQMLHRMGFDYREYREKYPRVWELSHNSQRKMSMVLIEKGQEKTCFVKGAPEVLLAQCSHVWVNGNREPIEQHLGTIQAALDKASSEALRVIAFSEKEGGDGCVEQANSEKCLTCGGHTLVALVGITDPIRVEVPAAVETCRNAGVEVKMITGDAVPTAVAIAKQAGILSNSFELKKLENLEQTDSLKAEIWKNESEIVLTSAELAKVGDDDLPKITPKLRVLARSTPMDKLRLIKAMHYDGEVVAMTGDGTNDAPALKFADVGISMGQTGTEVAKEASDIVLIDDNFKSIVTGIWWGRTLYLNIQRFLQFQLSVNFVALTCALIGPLFGVPLPLTVPQLLWINIIMDTFAAIGYSTDPPRASSMRRKPIPKEASIITSPMGVSILANGAYQVIILFLALYFGWFLNAEDRFTFHLDVSAGKGVNLKALSMFFTIFVMFQFWHKFNCRSLSKDESPFVMLSKNHLFIMIIGMITVIQVILVQASGYFGIGEIFRTSALSLTQWLCIAALTFTIIPYAWLVRRLTKVQ